MKLSTNKEGGELTISLEGRLDTTSAPELDNAIKTSIEGITSLVLDFTALEYISSAGLRVLLSAQKLMNKQGKMVIHGVNDVVNDVFEMTGFSDILTIE